MELHHGLASDYEPAPEVDGETALMIGTKALAERESARREEIAQAFAKADELFARYPNGVRESQLIHEVKDALNIRLPLAAAAVDRIGSSDRVVKDWQTGFLTPVA